MADTMVIIMLEVEGGLTHKFKFPRNELKNVTDIMNMISSSNCRIDNTTLQYYDEDCNTYIALEGQTFKDAGFHSERLVKMKAKPAQTITLCLDQAATAAGASIVVLESDSVSDINAPTIPSRKRKAPAKLRETNFPKTYKLPAFPALLVKELDTNDKKFRKTGIHTQLPKKLLTVLMETIINDIFQHSYYPTTENLDVVAGCLLAEHPSVGYKEDSASSWNIRLGSKANTMRMGLKKAGVLELSVSSKVLATAAKVGRRRFVNHRGEVNGQPELPEGETEDTLNESIQLMIGESDKKLPDMALVKEKMRLTYPSRRWMINTEKPAISTVKDKFPFLFTEEEV